MKRIVLTILLLSLVPAGGLHAETDDKIPIEIIELGHRSADEIMPHVGPLLGPRDSLTGTGYRLILRTSPGRLNRIRELVAALDRPVRELRLFVHVEDSARRGETRLDPAGEYRNERGAVVRRYATTDRDGEQWVRVRDGQQAHIREGEIIPMAGIAVLRADGTLIGGVDYHSLERGFLVTPSVMPDGDVRLHIVQISEHESRGGGGRTDTRSLETVVTLEPGEWVDLGGILGRGEDTDRRIIGTRSTHERQAATVRIRVEPVE